MIKSCKDYLKHPSCFFLLLALIESIVFWPGIMRPDSMGQLSLATGAGFMAGNDHHPPAMAFLWHYVAILIPGSGGMLLFHEIIFWIGISYFYRCLKHPFSRLILIISVFIPQMLVLRPFILKDIGFAVCLVCVAGLLTYVSVQKRPLKWREVCTVVALLFYGAAVKFQALYASFLFIIWLVFLMPVKVIRARRMLYAIAGYFLFMISVNGFNHLTSKPSHSWQYVKLYDLAGISLYKQESLFPDFVLDNENYSFEKLQKLYSPKRVDEMVFPAAALLIKGKTGNERNALQSLWWKCVLNYPAAYLHHRWGIFREQMRISPLKGPSELKSPSSESPSSFIRIGQLLEDLHLMKICQTMTSFAPYMLLLLFYCIIGALKKDSLHTPVLMMNLSGMWFILILFFLSMAAEFRYLYFTTCMLHISHALILEMYLTRKKGT